jgi:hypothetical protein
VLICLTMSAASGCTNSQNATESAAERLKPQAAQCAGALADGPIQAARAECLAHLAQLEAALNWK